MRNHLIKYFMSSLVIFSFFAELKAQKTDDIIKLESFSQIPSEIDGCVGLYTYDSISLKKGKYIIATDLQKFAFIKIDGNKIQLKFVGNDSLLGDVSQRKKTYAAVYKGINYQIILNTIPAKSASKTSEEEETWFDKGTVEISVGNKRIKIKVHGRSGC